jgi:hypothetical protein
MGALRGRARAVVELRDRETRLRGVGRQAILLPQFERTAAPMTANAPMTATAICVALELFGGTELPDFRIATSLATMVAIARIALMSLAS